MENWKVEIKRLDKIRVDLNLNWNQLEKLTSLNRGKIQRFFESEKNPSMKVYFDLKEVLENQQEVVFENVDAAEEKPSVEVDLLDEYIKSKNQTTCDCRMSGNLFLRGKSGCKKTREEHKF